MLQTDHETCVQWWCGAGRDEDLDPFSVHSLSSGGSNGGYVKYSSLIQFESNSEASIKNANRPSAKSL